MLCSEEWLTLSGPVSSGRCLNVGIAFSESKTRITGLPLAKRQIPFNCHPPMTPLNPPPSQEMLSSVAEALSIDLETVYVAKNSKPLENDFSARNCAAWYIESAIGGE